jgi:pyrroloquinoline quinone biosynthesis protein D
MSATHPKIARRARLRFDEREKKYLLVYPERGLLLNDSAAEIVKLCDGTRTLDEIAIVLAEKKSAPIERVLADVRALVARLEEKRLVE